MGLLDEAAKNSKKALKIDKSLVAAKMNIANIEFQKGYFKKAIKLLEVIVSEEPSYQEAKANLALAYKNIQNLYSHVLPTPMNRHIIMIATHTLAMLNSAS